MDVEEEEGQEELVSIHVVDGRRGEVLQSKASMFVDQPGVIIRGRPETNQIYA